MLDAERPIDRMHDWPDAPLPDWTPDEPRPAHPFRTRLTRAYARFNRLFDNPIGNALLPWALAGAAGLFAWSVFA